MTQMETAVELRVAELFAFMERWHPINVFRKEERDTFREYLVQLMINVVLWERSEQEQIVAETMREYAQGSHDQLNAAAVCALRLVARRQLLRRTPQGDK